MGDDAQKRTTDCVYFLASPLTCKKGNDCEYRHSEAARINPRDCWYWLSGNCLNANCSFRHPPLDGRPDTSPSTPTPIGGGTSGASTTAVALGTGSSSSPLPVTPTTSKSMVPCYFFSQGFCAKGGKCSFSHGPLSYFRKEATTYQKPEASEQTENGAGNGFSYVKPQLQESKLASQAKPSIRATISSQDTGFVPSNVYKLTVPKVSVSAGEKADQISHTAKSKLDVNTNDSSTRQGQPVESRISQAHLGDECVQPAAPFEKGGIKGQPSQLDLGRRVQKPGRQSSSIYKARTSDELTDPEMEDALCEPDAQHGARELHAGDLRNHLKRKKNDSTFSSQQKNLHRKEYPKERFESGHLASKAVVVVEAEDFAPSTTKRAKEDKEIFSGPKTLAQIKAEKRKLGAEDSFKDADLKSQGQDVTASDLLVRRKVQLASELHGKSLPVSYDESNHVKPADEECNFELGEAGVHVALIPKDFEGSSYDSFVLRPSIGSRHSNGISSKVLPLMEVKISGSHTFENENAEKNDDQKVDVPISRTNKGNMNLRSEGTLRGGTHANISGTETEYISSDDLIEDGSEVQAVYASDDDEDDDFAKKLGRFLS